MMIGDAMQMQCWEDGPTTTRMQREFPYRCTSGSGNAMGSSTGCSSAKDVGRGGLASTQGPMLDNQGDAQYGVLLEHSPR